MAVSIKIELEGCSEHVTVRKLTGTEEMSTCYHYDVIVETAATGADSFNPLGKAATLQYLSDDQPTVSVAAKVAGFVQITDPALPADKARFRLRVAPDLWFMSLGKRTKIYIDQTLTDILGDQFSKSTISNQIADLSGKLYEARPFTCQYNETGLNFTSRLMEDRGVYYYFDHDSDGKLVISDNVLDYGAAVELDVSSEIEPGTWSRIVNVGPTKMRLTGYDFTKPSYEVFGEFEIEDGVPFEVHVNDEPVRDQEEAAALAQVRLEQARMMHDYVTFRSFSSRLAPGRQFTKDGTDYLVMQVHHTYVHEDTSKSNDPNHYRNTVTAIRSEILFRPSMKSRVPRADGSEIAHIHSDMTSSPLAMLDESGHYTVMLNYVSDRADPPLAKLRMQQPASGGDDSIYFPLKNGVEVVIAFAKGNPDLPYIDGTMSNGQFPSHVTAANSHHSVIKAQHMLLMKSLGGSHTSFTAEKFTVEEDHAFEKLTIEGTAEGAMDDEAEKSGLNHIERRYGHKYSYIDGCDYNWLKHGAGTFNFGFNYVENHDSAINVSGNSFDMNPLVQAINGEFEERKAGFVEKTWGDRAIYHKGRAMTWGGGDGPGTSLQTYNYGPRYTENLIDDDQGTSADKGGMHDAGAGKVGSNARTEKTFGDTYGYQSGMAVSVHEGDVDHEHHGNVTEVLEGDTEFKRTGKMKITQDGDVESEYMTNIETSTHGDIKETTDGKVTSTILGKIKQKYNGGRETTELAKTTHTYKAALTVKQFSVEETTDNTKTENVKGAHMINYSSNVIEKGAKMKSQDAKMLMMKGSMAQMKIDLIMIG